MNSDNDNVSPAASLVRSPFSYHSGVEQPSPDEDRDGLRSVHARSSGLLCGSLQVLPDLPPPLAQGVSALPRSCELNRSPAVLN